MAKKKAEREAGLIERLKEAIKASGLSLNQLGKESGVATAQLSRFMAGKRTLTMPAADKLCRALGLDLTQRPK